MSCICQWQTCIKYLKDTQDTLCLWDLGATKVSKGKLDIQKQYFWMNRNSDDKIYMDSCYFFPSVFSTSDHGPTLLCNYLSFIYHSFVVATFLDKPDPEWQSKLWLAALLISQTVSTWMCLGQNCKSIKPLTLVPLPGADASLWIWDLHSIQTATVEWLRYKLLSLKSALS